MKTYTTKQYQSANTILIALTSIILGYNIYQEIFHPEKSNLTFSIILVIMTYIVTEKYSTPTKKDKKAN